MGWLDLAVLAMAAAGNLPVWVSADRADDILQALALAESEGLTIVIVGATEGWRVAPALAAARVPVVVDPLSNLPRSLEAMQSTAWNAALLRAAGVEVVLSSGETHNARNLRYVAGNAVRDGLHPADALRAITWAPAIAAGLGGDRGTLQVGHVANVAVWSDDPLAIASRLQRLYVRGHEATTHSRQDALMERYREETP